MRLSFVGSTGSFGSTHSSRLPLPLVSRMNGVQPCDFTSSPVSSNILRLIQPTTLLAAPPLLSHSVLLASSAKTKWCVEKQVLIKVNFFAFGSYIDTWRFSRSRGNTLADGCPNLFCKTRDCPAGGPSR